MQKTGFVNVADTEYGEIRELGDPTSIRDYSGKRVFVNRAQLKGTGFFLYIVTDWWAVYSESIIWIAASIILFLACIIIINVMINRIVRWHLPSAARAGSRLRGTGCRTYSEHLQRDRLCRQGPRGLPGCVPLRGGMTLIWACCSTEWPLHAGDVRVASDQPNRHPRRHAQRGRLRSDKFV